MFTGSGFGHEAVPSRRLLIHVFHSLASVGYHLLASTDMSKKEWDKDTLIFRPGPSAPHRWFFAVSLNDSDKIRIIDPPNEGVKMAFIGAVRVSRSSPRCYLPQTGGSRTGAGVNDECPWICS
jgi:hypothetical protein